MGGPLSCHRGGPGREYGGLPYGVDRININTATEEQLMTLPGVSRAIAHSIVEYRQQISGFRKVEDLALVSGIGAAKLQHIQPEICVGPLGPDAAEHTAATAAATTTSAPGAQTRAPPDGGAVPNESNGKPDGARSNGPRPASLYANVPQGPNGVADGAAGAAAGVAAAAAGAATGSGRVGRPPSPCLPGADGAEGRPSVRLGTWDLTRCTAEKAENPGVREVIGMTLLENGIKLLAVQDVMDRASLEKICMEMNEPITPQVSGWEPLLRGSWRGVLSEPPQKLPGQDGIGCEQGRLGFLWDTDTGIELLAASSLHLRHRDALGHDAHISPFLGHFTAGGFEFILLNVHTRRAATADAAPAEDPSVRRALVEQCLRALDEHIKEERAVLLMGGFSCSPEDAAFDALRDAGFRHCLPPGEATELGAGGCVDNIWINPAIQRIFTGRACAVREGLCSSWIPDGWEWGGAASRHCPVWAEFMADVDTSA
uniref:Endonuclease/exonuclease/phosphatase family domain-containing protein 1-like n=1 Tax=Petromyzon marinus TaxID=7757 RepID=A0AAJ7U8K8_PETMA|nr:endonuclease/exonuclease/phosphatase family domain-containing protein 1-like [Petromyzon marinus]XP_032830656.1 endonuclease/exonuclease/phosphatase family domain-containing protein 1-like [Petromyzon marinus]